MFKKYIARGSKKYAYLVESYRENDKIKQRTIRYLGKVIWENGEEKIIPPKKRLHSEVKVKHARRYGDVTVLHNIADELGIKELLNRQIVKNGVDPADLTTILAINRAIEPTSGNKLSSWYADTALTSLIGLDETKVTSENIGKLFDAMYTSTEAGGIQDKIFQFEIDLWKKLNGLYDLSMDAVVYDITSTYVYGTKLPLAVKGYNRDNNHHVQYNIGLVVTHPQGIPIHFKVYPGNIVDVTTIKGILNDLKPFKIHHATFIVDRGFYSADNLVELVTPSSDVIGAIPASLKLFSQLLSRSRTIEQPTNAQMRKDELLYIMDHYETINDVSLKFVVVLDPVLQEQQRTTMMKDILGIQTELNHVKQQWETGSFKGDINEKLSNIRKGYKKCFTVTIKKYMLTIKRHEKAIQRRLNQCGKYILYTSRTTMDALDILDTYFEKDVVEKSFFVIKQLHDLQPTRKRLENRVYGYVFIGYLAYLLYTVLKTRLPKELKLSPRSALEELARVRQIDFTEESDMENQLTELTKMQKDIVIGLKMKALFGLK